MTEHTVKCNALKLYYKKCGIGKPLILLHGNGEDGGIFEVAAERLGEKFTVYVPDSRGHGKSQKAPLSYIEMAEDMRQFIEALNLERPAFYGFSDGGIIGLILAYKTPDLLSKLVVSGVNLNPKALKRSFRFWVQIGHFFSRNKMLKLMLKEPNISFDELTRIQAKTLILAGEKDIVIKQHSEAVAAAIKGAELKILAGENHFSYVFDNHTLFQLLTPFLLEE